MNRLQRAAVMTKLADELSARGSWCGETHIQKAVFVLQELKKVPLGYEFILYKHGPFSFDLRDELTEMRADGLIELVPQPYPYGPTLLPTNTSKGLRDRFPKTLGKYEDAIEFVGRKLGNKGVVELEKLSTALFVTLELGEDSAPKNRAKRVNELKPHLTMDAAVTAIKAIDELIQEASS